MRKITLVAKNNLQDRERERETKRERESKSTCRSEREEIVGVLTGEGREVEVGESQRGEKEAELPGWVSN